MRQEFHKTPTSLMRKILLEELLAVHNKRFQKPTKTITNDAETTWDAAGEETNATEQRGDVMMLTGDEPVPNVVSQPKSLTPLGSPLLRARSFLAYCAILDNILFSRLPRQAFVGEDNLTPEQMRKLVANL